MGLSASSFRLPDFQGKGGLPCSLEWLLRRVEAECGAHIGGAEWLVAGWQIAEYIDEVEDYWERDKGARPTVDCDYHNLAVWGFEVADAYGISAGLCREKMGKAKDNWFRPPGAPRFRTARRVLNPAHLDHRETDTQLSIAKRIAERDGGIENLILFLGANNCLGTIIDLDIRETGLNPPGVESGCTLWSAEAFEAEYTRLAEETARLNARNVFVGTVPHVTIPPATRGVMRGAGRLPSDRRYFDYYTRPWVKDKEFDPGRHPHLTGDEARRIDDRIDNYNETIRKFARAGGWHVVDTCGTLDRLAVRRNHGEPAYTLPDALSDLSIRFFEINRDGSLRNGGLISLDGVHPTACGYGIVAQEFINVMRPLLSAAGEPIRDVDFDDVRRWDSLVSRPPRTLDDVFGALQFLERRFHLSHWVSKDPMLEP